MSRPPVASRDLLSPAIGALENRSGTNLEMNMNMNMNMRCGGGDGERSSVLVPQEIFRNGPNLHSNNNNNNSGNCNCNNCNGNNKSNTNTKLPRPFSNPPQYFPASSLPNGPWSVDRLAKPFNPGTGEQQRVTAITTSRKFSDQDIKTRSARAALQFSSSYKHKKSSASYPTYFPNAPATAASGYSSTPPFLPWGVAHTMEPRISPRPGSSGSNTTKSSFESRHKSPLSISSSVDNESSASTRTSVASSRSSFADDFHSPTTQHRFIEGTQTSREPGGPILARYGVVPAVRQQKLLIPQRLSKNPQSPTNQTFETICAPVRLGEGFKKLPEEILLNCLAVLKKLHLDAGCLSCSTCWMRDVISVGGSCKKWWGAARGVLYEDIQLVGSDSVLHTKKRYKVKYGTRLRLLRRTLQARPDLAQYVKSLKVPALPEAARNQKEKDQYLDLVASVIMACPNLERLSGFYPAYNHEFSRFVHAMSTRTKLREHLWVISGSSRQLQYQQKQLTSPDSPIEGFLPAEQCIDFLTFHNNWSNLQTLVMHCNPDGTMNSPLFTDIFESLPSLENLHISSFPSHSFDDTTLLSLPSLTSLRLENLRGITDNGLSNFASFARTKKLKSLALISLSLVSLPVLARVFSHLKYLTSFTISQTSPPSGVEIFLYPYLASSTLEHMHWEFEKGEDSKATEILARSISCSGFPSLKTIRAPSDSDGSLQKLCRPRDRIELPADKYRKLSDLSHNGIPTSQSLPSMPSPTQSTFSGTHSHRGSVDSNVIKSPTRSTFSFNMGRPSSRSGEPAVSASAFDSNNGMSLSLARRMAQQRIDAATTRPKFHIIIWDENGAFSERHALGGFIGSIQSNISYVLKPDLEGSDESLMAVEALLDGGEEANVRDGCTGTWNLDLGIEGGSASVGKKEKDRWRHTERGRWRPLSLEKLF